MDSRAVNVRTERPPTRRVAHRNIDIEAEVW